MKTDRNDTDAHLMIAAYWLCKIFGGGDALKTTLQAADLERRLALSNLERAKEQATQSSRFGKARMGRAAAKAKMPAKAKVPASVKRTAAALSVKALKTVLKKQRVY